jgi:transposase
LEVKKLSNNKYNDDFKREAIKLAEKARQEGRSMSSVAKSLGVNPKNIYNWMEKSVKNEKGEIITDSEYTRIKKELKEVRLERDILKKAVAIFSKQQK